MLHDPLSWNYLTAPPDRAPVWGPLSIAFVVLVALGLLATIALHFGLFDVGERLRRKTSIYDTMHRSATRLIPVLAAGLLFFIFRMLRVSIWGLSLSMRLWLYLVCLAAIVVVGSIALAPYTRPIVGRIHKRRARDGENALATRWYRWIALGLFVVYMVIAVALYIFRGVYLHPDRWAILLFVAALLLGQWKQFLRDWIPVVLLLFGYEFMRGLAFQYIGHHQTINPTTTHAATLIAADRDLFGGHIPAIWLQHLLYTPGKVHWYDIMSVVIYAMLFVVPLLVAFVLWIGSKQKYWHFMLAFLGMTYIAFVIYLFYPAAPPWMASDWKLIPTVQIPFNQVWHLLVPHPLNNYDQASIWTAVAGNSVAAMPSVHAAYPWLTLLYAVKYFKKKGLILVPYNLAVWFTVLYLGQHWAIDIIAGVVLATLCFVGMELAWSQVGKLAARRRQSPAPAVAGSAVAGRLQPAVRQQQSDNPSS